MAQVGSKMTLRWRQDGLKRCLLGVLWPSWVVLGMLMVLGSSWVCFESFLATSWGVLGCLFGCFASSSGCFGLVLIPTLDRVAKLRSSQHVFLKAHGVAITWFQSGRASAASERAQRAKRAERQEDLAIQLSFKRLLLTRLLRVHEGSESSPK